MRVTLADDYASGRTETPHDLRLYLGSIGDRTNVARREVLAQLLVVQVPRQRLMV